MFTREQEEKKKLSTSLLRYKWFQRMNTNHEKMGHVSVSGRVWWLGPIANDLQKIKLTLIYKLQ